MRAIRYYEHGGPEVLRLDDVTVPEPTGSQVLIEVEAIGANAIDTVLRRGGSPWPRPLPATLTGDVVGRITRLGPDVAGGVRVGQRVAALSDDAFAEQVVADANWLAPVPDEADAGEASVLSMTAPLALRLLKAGRIAAGETVLIHSAAGTIGHLAVQLARSLGAGTVIGTASAADKLDFIRAQGADAAIDLSKDDWPDQLRTIAPKGVDLMLDAIGGKVFDQGLEALAPLGRMVSYGAISGDLPEVPSSALFALKSVTGVGLLAWRTARPDEARNDITEVTQLWQSGVLRPAIHARFPLAEAARLHKILDDRANLGRLVATV